MESLRQSEAAIRDFSAEITTSVRGARHAPRTQCAARECLARVVDLQSQLNLVNRSLLSRTLAPVARRRREPAVPA